MANLQAIGFDNNTVIYLLAEGSGTDLDPYISKYKLVDQDLLAKDATLAAIADKIPQLGLEGDRLMVAANGTVALDAPTLTAISDLIPIFTFDGTRLTVETGLDLSLLATDAGLAAIADKIPDDLSTVGGRLLVDADVTLPPVFTVEGTVSTGLDQPLTLAELQSVIVNVSEQSPLDLLPLAKEVTLAAIANAIPEFTFDGTRLTVATELDQPLTLAQLETAIAQIKDGLANQTNQETANTLLNDIKNLVPIFTFSDSRLNVATGLNQPLTLAQLQEIIVATQEQDPLDISELAKQTTLEALLNKIALEGDRIKVDVGTGQGLTNDQLRAQPVPIIFDLSSLATKTNQDATNTRLGDIAESPPSTDTASSGINGRLVRLLQRLTTLIGLFPPSLGAKTAANSLAVTLATDGVASGIANQIGEVQTTPTANTVLDRLRTIATLLSGTIRNSPIAASTPTLTNVASSANSVTLLASNSNRKTAIIVNDSTSILYIKFDASAASTTSYSLVLPPITNSIPSFVTISGSDYAGEIRGIWASANGFARITEVV